MRAPAALLVAVAAAVAGCAAPSGPEPAPPSQDDVPVPVVRKPVTAAGYEQRLRDRALVQGRQGRLAEAALSWEILMVLRPDSSDYRDRLAETRRLVEAALADRLQRAVQAAKRNDIDGAATHYLAALALQPDHPLAAEALRGIERERNKRSYLGKPSRITLTRRAATEAQMAGPSSTVPLDRNEVEHAALLGTQGEFDDAIALLERYLAVDKRDPAACRLLADLYLRKGEKQMARDKAGAITAFEKSLRIDATNAKTVAYLRQLRPNGQLTILPAAAAGGRDLCKP
jgi:tetratricopeptide (TPR) repeat protein